MEKTIFETPGAAKFERPPLDFYTRTDVVQIARDLLGKVVVTRFEGEQTAGIITETEAYRAPDDRASHAFGNRRTTRTDVMFREGGRAYIYLCYGIHHLFNVVTAPEDTAHAVLIRAIEPVEGVEIMMRRRGMKENGSTPSKERKINTGQPPTHLTTGPGAMAQALGLTTKWTGQSLFAAESPVWIEDRGENISENEIMAGKRIGVDYAGECAEWPWRFWLRDSPFVKRG